MTGQWSLVALTGPANRQGRIAADQIAGRDSRFRGTKGTAIGGLFDGTVAWTGAGEKALARTGKNDFEKIFTPHAIWPFLWIWATLYRPDRGYGVSSKTGVAQLRHLAKTNRELERRIAALEERAGGGAS